MAATANLTIDQGATFSSDITVKDNAGNPLNLTDYTASAKMALGYSSTRTRVTMTTAFASDRTTGILTISLTADQTNTLSAPARYLYDVEITASDSTVTRVIEGIITVNPSITT